MTFLNTAAKPSSGTTYVQALATLGLGVGSGSNYFAAADLDNLFAGTMSNVNNDPNSNVGIDTTQGDFMYASGISSTRGLVKLGANTLTLTGSSNYSGSTTVSNGILSVSGGGAINGTSSVIIQSGGLLDVSNGAVTVAGGGTFARATKPRARVR